MSETKTYIVPHDFTQIGNSAAQHGIFMAKKTGANVVLLHIVKTDQESAPAKAKFQEILKSLNIDASMQSRVKTIVGVGNIFEDIAKVSKKYDASLIIMGTHGAKGMQKVFGSFAIKVITSTRIPFMVVQETPPQGNIDKIVVPINMTKESLQIVNAAAEIAKYFGAEVHILASKYSDPSMQKKMNNRITVVKKKFNEHSVRAKFGLVPGNKTLDQKALAYGEEIDADMYAVAYHTDSLIKAFDKFAQNLITNSKQKPVLILTAVDSFKGYF